MLPVSNNVQSPENAFLDMIITLITGRAAEQQLGPAEAAVSEEKIKLIFCEQSLLVDMVCCLKSHLSLQPLPWPPKQHEDAQQTQQE